MNKALVTGSSFGLGAAMVLALKSRGFEVVGVDKNAPASDAVDLSIVCDLASRAALDQTLPAIIAAGPYAIVFMNAGISATGKFETIPIAAQLAVLQVNLEAPIVMTNALLKAGMLQGPVCFVSSLSHFCGYPGASTYAASKDGLAAYAKSLRKAGIQTTVAFPGPLDTPHAAQHAPTGSKANRRMKPDVAAQMIVDAVIAGKRRVVPGLVAKLARLMGRLFPTIMTKFMRKTLYEKLHNNEW